MSFDEKLRDFQNVFKAFKRITYLTSYLSLQETKVENKPLSLFQQQQPRVNLQQLVHQSHQQLLHHDQLRCMLHQLPPETRVLR